jgi:hypothetical protein
VASITEGYYGAPLPLGQPVNTWSALIARRPIRVYCTLTIVPSNLLLQADERLMVTGKKLTGYSQLYL